MPCRKHGARKITIIKRYGRLLLTSWLLDWQPNTEKNELPLEIVNDIKIVCPMVLRMRDGISGRALAL